MCLNPGANMRYNDQDQASGIIRPGMAIAFRLPVNLFAVADESVNPVLIIPGYPLSLSIGKTGLIKRMFILCPVQLSIL